MQRGELQQRRTITSDTSTQGYKMIIVPRYKGLHHLLRYVGVLWKGVVVSRNHHTDLETF